MDRHQERRGPRAFREHPRAFSEMQCYWVAPEPPTAYEGISLGDPFFLQGFTEVDLFGRVVHRDADAACAAMHDHLFLERLYGIRQQTLQFACEVYPSTANKADVLTHEGLLVQIVSRELRFATTDTLHFNDTQRTLLGLGESVMIFHEVDVQSLPPGTYMLSCVPLDGKGRPWLTEFDVVWSLGVPRRRGDEELAIARLLLPPDDVAVFRGADALIRGEMLNAYWDLLDPEPETPQNEAWIEFLVRVGYVRQHLGGFGLDGSMDPRAEVYLRKGTPSRIVFEKDASNEAARTGPNQDKWQDFRPFEDSYQDQESIVRSGVSPSLLGKITPMDVGKQNNFYGQQTGRFPGSRTEELIGAFDHRLARHSRGNTFEKEPVAETWYYGHGGFSLFEHAWSDKVPRAFQVAFSPEKGEYKLRWVRETTPADADDPEGSAMPRSGETSR